MSHNVVRQEDFEGTPGGTGTSIGGGPAASAEAGLHYEGSQAYARRIGGTGTDRGFYYAHDDIGTVDLTAAANEVLMVKAFTIDLLTFCEQIACFSVCCLLLEVCLQVLL